ncbi:HEAT repeat domain-containing protein [Gemmata sp. G18]|uniref:HEAT repeat domain-containing protein n=1 Tax=Gemmata palustris TaxID=2822762 RepID=A0ABS5C410_9BACT|nr:HEAT repeat domain-containing protein [Gemmata palustris]MBP3960729.1 HEAT repeat domain-containing protein [Gemmata palustris]
MVGYRSSRFVPVLVAGALMLSGPALAQQTGVQTLLPPPITIPVPPPPATSPLPSLELPALPTPPQPQPVPNFMPSVGGLPPTMPAPIRLAFKIDPNASVKDLLPPAPKIARARGPLVTDDLTKVEEVEFEARPEKVPSDGKLTERAAHQLAKINHMNAKKTDAFMAALVENRPDLAGLPFAMGDDCRTSGERSKQFGHAVATIRRSFPNQTTFGRQADGVPPGVQGFWPLYTTFCDQEDATRSRTDKVLAEHVAVARIAALMQMLAPESPELRTGLVKYLAAVQHAEATKALAKLAVFSSEDEVRNAAIDVLKVRREKDYTDILVKGLRYPFPAVAKRSADAITRIGRTDLIAELVAVLEEEDPRMPQLKKDADKKTLVVREMVKVNHHRNCMMCHAPNANSVVPASALAAEVPVQGQPLPTPAQGYRQSSPELMIRLDVTYLRQDFSVMLAVADAHPWPELQRFDFLVRERTLTGDEAAAYRDKLTPKEIGVLSPYHRAALAALRELTGKDTSPTAAAWRKLLDMPTKSDTKTKTEVIEIIRG